MLNCDNCGASYDGWISETGIKHKRYCDSCTEEADKSLIADFQSRYELPT